MAIVRDEKWVNFIQKYKSLRLLWDQRHEKYKSKASRRKAYEKLHQEYRKIDKMATLEAVKKRINNMRTTYLRELRKKISSEHKGTDVNDRYEPLLWYFNDFQFLNGHLEMSEGVGGDGIVNNQPVTMSDNVSIKNRTSSDDEPVLKNIPPTPTTPPNKSFLRKENLTSNYKRPRLEKDEAAIYTEAWACSYRKLTEEQRLYARKACDEIFVLGQLGRLTLYSVRIEELNEIDDTTFPYRENLYVQRMPIEKDEATIYAEAWSCSYKKLSEEQKLYAKKACDEIFIMGQLGKLTLYSVRTEEEETNQNHDTSYSEEFCVEKFTINE